MVKALCENATNDTGFAIEKIPECAAILSPWFREGSLGFIFGRRGTGKTWFAWKMAICISKGEDFGPWKCERPCKTLYIDGEMRRSVMQSRMNSLNHNPSGNLFIISREQLANVKLTDEKSFFLNLCEQDQQKAFLTYCVQEKFKVVFLDNLSSLCFGMKENEADSWEQVLSWLLMFRQSGIAMIIVHHANRDGNEMRGTSRREDAADWVIKVSPTYDFVDIENETAFSTEFTKNRDSGGQNEISFNWTFITENGQTEVVHRPKSTLGLFLDLVESGVVTNKEIAEALELKAYKVTRLANQLIQDGCIEKDGQVYRFIQRKRY
jgi:hypothetical protein